MPLKIFRVQCPSTTFSISVCEFFVIHFKLVVIPSQLKPNLQTIFTLHGIFLFIKGTAYCVIFCIHWTRFDTLWNIFRFKINRNSIGNQNFPEIKSNQNICVFGWENHAHIWKYAANQLDDINIDVCQQFPVYLYGVISYREAKFNNNWNHFNKINKKSNFPLVLPFLASRKIHFHIYL